MGSFRACSVPGRGVRNEPSVAVASHSRRTIYDRGCKPGRRYNHQQSAGCHPRGSPIRYAQGAATVSQPSAPVDGPITPLSSVGLNDPAIRSMCDAVRCAMRILGRDPGRRREPLKRPAADQNKAREASTGIERIRSQYFRLVEISSGLCRATIGSDPSASSCLRTVSKSEIV